METKTVEKLDYSSWRKKNTVMLIRGGWFGNQTPCYVGDAQPKTEKEWKELYKQSRDKKAVQCEPCAIEITKEEPKQETKEETIEEAAERMEILQKIDCDKMKLYFDGGSYSLGFYNGAKWQQERDKDFYFKYIKSEKDFQIPRIAKLGISTTDQIFEQMVTSLIHLAERSYSQLDVVRILSKYETLSNEDFNQWFEEFKK